MKALLLRQYGSPAFLEVDEVEKPVPKENQLLVKVHAVSIDDRDRGLILGTPFVPNRLMAGLRRPKTVVGPDIAGRVKSGGSRVTRFKPGDEVYGDLSGCGFGGFAEFVCAPESALMFKSPKQEAPGHRAPGQSRSSLL